MNFGAKKSGIIPVKGKVTTVKVQGAKKPQPLASVGMAKQQAAQKLQQSRDSPARASPSSATASPATPSDQHDSSHLRPPATKRKASRQLSPADQRLESDSSGDDNEDGKAREDDFDTNTYKRQKTDQPVDHKRKLRSKEAFSELDGGKFEMIHAVDVIPDDQNSRNHTVASSENIVVRLRYPSASQPERSDILLLWCSTWQG